MVYNIYKYTFIYCNVITIVYHYYLHWQERQQFLLTKFEILTLSESLEKRELGETQHLDGRLGHSLIFESSKMEMVFLNIQWRETYSHIPCLCLSLFKRAIFNMSHSGNVILMQYSYRFQLRFYLSDSLYITCFMKSLTIVMFLLWYY